MNADREALLETKRSTLRSAVFATANFFLHGVEWFVTKFSKVDTTPFLSDRGFPWAAEFEARWEEIRAEIEQLRKHKELLPNFQEISKDQDLLTQDDLWKTVFLEAYGVRSVANRQRCPVTAELIDRVPGMKLAMFSMLAGGKHIPAHRGPWKGVVRYHLGLIVPDPPSAARIRVHDELYSWQAGRGVFFDDSYQHEVWNDSNQDRVVLFLDVVRPCGFPLNWVNHAVLWLIAHSPFVRDLAKNQADWERKFAQVG